MKAQVIKHRFTVDEYAKMAEAGVLDPDRKVELIDGEIVEMSPIGFDHAGCVTRASHLFFGRLQGRALVRIQNPVLLDEYWAPEPDVVLVHLRSDFYTSGHPKPPDVFLAIEVSDTTQEYDRETKIPRYGAAGIAESWLANLASGVLEVYRSPGKRGYRRAQKLGRNQLVHPLAFPDCEFKVSELLG